MTSKGFLNMLKSMHSPLSRIVILGFIVFGTIIGSTKISSSNNSPSSHNWVPSDHPFQPKQRDLPKQVGDYNYKGTKSSTGGRQINIYRIHPKRQEWSSEIRREGKW
jgi:hypothetical protein